MKYQVDVKEVHVVTIFVEADFPEEAIEKVESNMELVSLENPEYSHTLDSDQWSVCELSDEKTGYYTLVK